MRNGTAVGVLGAEEDWVDRMDGCLSHLRLGASLIDLQGYDAPAGRRMHAGGRGLADGAPLPARDPERGTLDHFAIACAPFDSAKARAYLTARGAAPFAEGARYGADGENFSLYARSICATRRATPSSSRRQKYSISGAHAPARHSLWPAPPSTTRRARWRTTGRGPPVACAHPRHARARYHHHSAMEHEGVSVLPVFFWMGRGALRGSFRAGGRLFFLL